METLPEHMVSLTLLFFFYGRSFSFVLVYLCIYTMFGFCIYIFHALERFFGIHFVYASTRFTHEKDSRFIVGRFHLFWFTSVFVTRLVFVSGRAMQWNVSLEWISSMHPYVSHTLFF